VQSAQLAQAAPARGAGYFVVHLLSLPVGLIWVKHQPSYKVTDFSGQCESIKFIKSGVRCVLSVTIERAM